VCKTEAGHSYRESRFFFVRLSRSDSTVSSYRWLVSSLIVFHLTSLIVATLPPPGELRKVAEVRTHVDSDAVAQVLTPMFDRTAIAVAKTESWLYSVFSPLRAVTRGYAGAGLTQRWRMFAHPSTADRYIRLRYYVDGGGPTLTATSELVLPVGDGESLRYFRGKAIRNALEAYHDKDYRSASSTTAAEPDPVVFRDLVPITRYYRSRFARAQSGTAANVVRTEFWFGRAPIPPPGRRNPPDVLVERAGVLAAYVAGTAVETSRYAVPRLGDIEKEADIVWELEYVEDGR
jgi:hypothetical protein